MGSGSNNGGLTNGVTAPAPKAPPVKHPVLQLPLTAVMKPQIALTLQHVLQLHTVGSFLNAWRNPKNHKSIEQVFDSPQQARHAAAVCATWLGVQIQPTLGSGIGAWWVGDDRRMIDA